MYKNLNKYIYMNIIFLFTGEARTFPFPPDKNKNKNNIDIFDSYNKYIFTDKFKSLCNYKIYISTNNIDIEDTINYFEKNNIGNIHLMDTNYYLNPIQEEIKNVEYYMDEYLRQDFKNCLPSPNGIFQHYKILDCYNLFKNDNPFTKIDYIIRLRMDCIICEDIFESISLLNNHPELEIIIKWDFFAIGKPKIMKCYCNGLDNNYGKYTNKTIVPDNLPIVSSGSTKKHDWNYKQLNDYNWLYSSERQLFEMIFEYCNDNELDINHSIYEAKEFCHILRMDGSIHY